MKYLIVFMLLIGFALGMIVGEFYTLLRPIIISKPAACEDFTVYDKTLTNHVILNNWLIRKLTPSEKKQLEVYKQQERRND